jgi:hypothetical protein
MGSAYHFVRVNGDTGHNDPAKPQCYVKDEPPRWPTRFFNYVDYCFANNLIRIGWPDTGDLRNVSDVPARTPCYEHLHERHRRYLRNFRDIQPGEGVLMPDKQRPGVLFAGVVTTPYSYFHDVPRHPYENAHRVGVKWDRHGGVPVEYSTDDFGISIHGGWWLWAYHKLDARRYEALVRRIDERRAQRLNP